MKFLHPREKQSNSNFTTLSLSLSRSLYYINNIIIHDCNCTIHIRSERNDLHPQVVLADLGERVEGNEQLGRDKAIVKRKKSEQTSKERNGERLRRIWSGKRERERRRSAWIRKGRAERGWAVWRRKGRKRKKKKKKRRLVERGGGQERESEVAARGGGVSCWKKRVRGESPEPNRAPLELELKQL